MKKLVCYKLKVFLRAVGVPARVIKTIRDDQLAYNIENADAYVEMGRQHTALVSP